MLLTKTQVRMFRSIEDSTEVAIDPKITILVGQNESGKTAFLQALYRARPIEAGMGYSVIEDYPRKSLSAYEREHEKNPATVCILTYQLTKEECHKINSDLGFALLSKLTFTVHHKYSNTIVISLSIPEKPLIDHILASTKLGDEGKTKAGTATTLREVLAALGTADLNETGQKYLKELGAKFGPTEKAWQNLLEYYIWTVHLSKAIPKFFYFDDYRLLPGKVNLQTLSKSIAAHEGANKTPLEDEDKAILGLLRMANVALKDLMDPGNYEASKAKLEGFSNSITDKVFKFWKQNTELDVEFDLKADPKDKPPYNEGTNLYIRIRNRRHRVTVPFSQRSKGFIWFFSFIVWFDSIQDQISTADELILLLDEPGLSLHALAQSDFLNYISVLAENHQVMYTTHSPFMVPEDRLFQARAVEDRGTSGSTVSGNISGSDPKTLFPLQAALGYTIAQNLFISKRNLLVEGPSDLIYLRFFSGQIELSGIGLREDVTIVPVGGLDKLATFVALLGANQLDIVVLHDYRSGPDPHLTSLVREKIIRERNILNFALFRDSGGPGSTLRDTDLEDLLSEELFAELFNGAYKSKLPKPLKASDLPKGERILERIDRWLVQEKIQLRPSGGFNHYLPTQYLSTNPPTNLDGDTLRRFRELFAKVNPLFSST